MPPVIGPHCIGCVNQFNGIARVHPDGSGENGVLIIGDSPWNDEIAKGIPFAGASGSYLNWIMSKRGSTRSEFTITNIMNCRPPHLGWTDHPDRFPEALLAQEKCRPYLTELLATGKYRAILTLGAVAMKALTGLEGVEENHGYVNISSYGIPVVSTFHPSFIIQKNHKFTICTGLAHDRALEIADGSYKPTKLTLYEDPSIDELNRYIAMNPDLLMCDIETPESSRMSEENAADDASYTIIRMGFSNSRGTGVSFPFTGGYVQSAKRAIREAKTILFWNKNYDLPRLRNAGFILHDNVSVIDAMNLWHFLQSDLPKSLAFTSPFYYSGPPWKHLNSQKPAFYNAMDNAIQMINYLGIKADLEAEGRWDRAIRHLVQCDPILMHMGDRGIRVDLEERNKFQDELVKDRDTALASVQKAIPERLFKVKRWKRKPKDMTGVVELALGQEGRFERVLPFNPNSPPQLRDLIRAHGLKVPKKRGEGDKETTDQKYLLRFGKKYPVFRDVVEYKRRSKLISTYMWPLNGRMRATTTYGFHPSTLRLSSRRVNLQNIPKRAELAKRFRKMLIAEPGKVLLEADFSAIEAVLVGYSAGSESYIKLAKAGVHGWLSSYVIRQPIDWTLPQDELVKLCKGVKRANPMVYEAAKRVVHGSNYMLSSFGIYDEYAEYFTNQKEADNLQRLYFSLPPGQDVRKWQEATMQLAHKEKKLRNHFDMIHYFYQVFKFSKQTQSWAIDNEGDAKRAIAFVPQSDAAFMQRELFLLMDESEEDRWLVPSLILPTHDSIIAEIEPDKVKDAARILNKYMTRKWPELGGLSIGVEMKVGLNLLEQDEVII